MEPAEPLLKPNAIAHIGLDNLIVSQLQTKGKAHNMICNYCQSEAKKNGKDINGNQRYRCNKCSKTFSDQQDKPLDGMYLPLDKAVQCIHQLVEGCSLRSTERLTGIDINTIMKLLVVVGTKCEQLLDERITSVPVKDVECDAIWCFVSMKEKTLKWKITDGHYNADSKMAEKLGNT